VTGPRFAAIVVLHRSAPELAALLASLARHGAPDRLVVADAGPDDGGAALARDAGAEVVALPGDPGFGVANNAALARIREPVTVLINPDCELVDAGSLPALVAAAAAAPRALHVPRLLNTDGSPQRSAHPLPGTVGALLPALVHPPLLPGPLRVRAEPHRAEAPRTVGWAIAACLAADTALLRELGPFDPAIHLFAEDMDLGLRARERGVPTVLHPALRIRHAGGHSTLRDGEPFALLARQRRVVVRARRGRPAAVLDDAAQALTFGMRLAAKRALGRPAARERAQLAALAAARGSDPL